VGERADRPRRARDRRRRLRRPAQRRGRRHAAAAAGDAGGGGGGGSDLVEPARLLASRGVRVFGVAVGSEQVAPDAAVERVDAPDWIYKDDTFRAAALLRLDGLAGREVTVELRRAGSAVTLKSGTTTPTSDRATTVVEFDDQPAEVGPIDYEVSVKPVEGEAVAENNVRRLRVTVKRDKLNALVIEDQPRWEYRYLTNYLERDQRVKLQKVLFQAASVANVERPEPVMASPANEGTDAQLLPDTPEKWAAFDLIVLGDVPPERLGPEQQAMLARAVKDRGAAMVIIAGLGNMPARYLDAADGNPVAARRPGANDATSVADLLPSNSPARGPRRTSPPT
jgi:hypothetical protein